MSSLATLRCLKTKSARSTARIRVQGLVAGLLSASSTRRLDTEASRIQRRQVWPCATSLARRRTTSVSGSRSLRRSAMQTRPTRRAAASSSSSSSRNGPESPPQSSSRSSRVSRACSRRTGLL
ncbi:unnamed protein product [Symbiodinium necroappetens]|uniref:Uncharacterized protein n=1 Tax=Symbiodinium necroappetens TaxID=1628268 RepID=A0A813A7Q5_9DINO|nr:unnamed protein product [Symbiodinium necroappetens]